MTIYEQNQPRSFFLILSSRCSDEEGYRNALSSRYTLADHTDYSPYGWKNDKLANFSHF